MMAKIKIHAANFDHLGIEIVSGALYIKNKWYHQIGDRVSPDEVVSLDVASEDSVKKIGGSLGWGVVGGALMGPVGLIAGIMLGGNKKDVTFVAELSGDRKFMATTDSKSFISLQAKSMKM